MVVHSSLPSWEEAVPIQFTADKELKIFGALSRDNILPLSIKRALCSLTVWFYHQNFYVHQPINRKQVHVLVVRKAFIIYHRFLELYYTAVHFNRESNLATGPTSPQPRLVSSLEGLVLLLCLRSVVFVVVDSCQM